HMTDTSYTKEEDIAFPSEIISITRQDRIEEYIAQQYHTILDRIDEMERNAHSGWIYDYGIKVYLEISAYQPLRGSSHFELPKPWNKPQLGIINPKNNDEFCFHECIKAHLRSETFRREGRRAQHLNEISRNRRYGSMVNFTGINAPASLRDIDRFEENNPSFSVNVFKPVLSENDKELKTHKLDPLRISEYNYRREHLVDLILFTQGEEEVGWHRIMRNWNKHHDHKYFCRHCLRAPFSRLDLLEDHIAHNCHGRNNPYAGQREIFPKKGKHISQFTNIKALLKAPFVIYPDNECDSNKLDEKEEDKNKNTVKIQKQVNNSFGYVMIQNDSEIISNVFRRTANSIEEKWKNMLEDLEMVKEILRNPVELKMTARDWENHNSARKCYLCEGLLQEVRYNKAKYFDNETQKFNGAAHQGCIRTVCDARRIKYKKSLYRTEHLTKKEEKAFNEAVKCVICKKNLKEEKKNKVRDHDHITGQYRGAAHRECNLQLQLKPDEIKIPVIYQGGKHYDFHLELLELGIITEEKIDPIADNMENYKSFTIGQFKFIDTIQFQLPSLEKIASNLRGGVNSPDELAKRFPILAQCFPKELLPLLTQKDEYPYELNDPGRFSRTKLPSREEFNTTLGGLNYCKQGCKKCKHEIKGKKCDGKCKSEDYKEVTDCEHEKIFTISQKQYDHAQKVWQETDCKTFEDYHMLYLKTDVLILADAFQNFRAVMIDAFELNPANYITLPSYAFDVAKKVTKVKLELFHEGQEDMHEFVQRIMRGGNSMAPRRIAKANFPGMKGAWEVKLKYPEKLHPSHSDFPLCPKRRIVTREELRPEQENMIKKLSQGKFAETEKLVATLETKDRYILNYRNLQQCLALGMELEHVYRVLEFDQSPWLEPYIMGNTLRRHGTRELKNKKVIGKWKDENAGTRITRYAGNRSKSYVVETENASKNIQKSKGLKKSLVNKELTIDIYERCILEGVEDKPRTAYFLQCERFVPYIIRRTKKSINPLDSKRWILNDRITTWAYGDCRIPLYLQALERYGEDIPNEILVSLGL
ncbi:15687_t:CDS:2, partial [Rhizophagus irregularis]